MCFLANLVVAYWNGDYFLYLVPMISSIPPMLEDIVLYLKEQNLQLSAQSSDGRVNSAINEDEILKCILWKFDVKIPRKREWYDFCIENETNFYPVNIKVTDTTHTDNLNCKLGIYYALTGLLPDFPNESPWYVYFEKLKENLGKSKDKDFYFLVFNKQKSQDIFLNTLKGLQKLQENGNNLPFQCKWDNNRTLENRSFEQAEKFILSVFGKSIKLRSEIYFNFKKHFPQYV
jgi:hypothetical protein